MFKKTFGGFDPATSDGTHLFVTGGRSIGAYLPVKTKK